MKKKVDNPFFSFTHSQKKKMTETITLYNPQSRPFKHILKYFLRFTNVDKYDITIYIPCFRSANRLCTDLTEYLWNKEKDQWIIYEHVYKFQNKTGTKKIQILYERSLRGVSSGTHLLVYVLPTLSRETFFDSICPQMILKTTHVCLCVPYVFQYIPRFLSCPQLKDKMNEYQSVLLLLARLSQRISKDIVIQICMAII